MPHDPIEHRVNMTVEDLILHLRSYPPTMLVGVDGYEGGTTTHIDVQVKRRWLDESAPRWEGEWQSQPLTDEGQKKRATKILVLSRAERT